MGGISGRFGRSESGVATATLSGHILQSSDKILGQKGDQNHAKEMENVKDRLRG